MAFAERQINVERVRKNRREIVQAVILKQFPVLWKGWESDETGYVVKLDDGSKHLVLGGTLVNAKEYEKKVAEYQDAIEQTQAAIELVKAKT